MRTVQCDAAASVQFAGRVASARRSHAAAVACGWEESVNVCAAKNHPVQKATVFKSFETYPRDANGRRAGSQSRFRAALNRFVQFWTYGEMGGHSGHKGSANQRT